MTILPLILDTNHTDPISSVIEALKHVASGVTWEIVTMHGAGEVSKMVKIVDALGIPYGIVIDYDQVRAYATTILLYSLCMK